MDRKRSKAEGRLPRLLLCASFFTFAWLAWAAPGGAVEEGDPTLAAPGGAVEEHGSTLAAPGAAEWCDRASEEPCDIRDEHEPSTEEPCSFWGWSGRAEKTPCIWDEYDSKEAGHPVRIAAYVLHPVGVIIDRLIFRPAYWIGSHEPFYTLFGRTD